jgi:hypothetical protein
MDGETLRPLQAKLNEKTIKKGIKARISAL